ncbi:MAG TPA: CoA protein activase [Anaerolineae bacterium]|nr:CoA protein activase [Anaerolineae bacterium]HIQ05370.1 CoA protein activase [Anaerolineae bacterium]
MKVGFPHVGTFYVLFESYLHALEAKPVVPPFSSQRTLDLGVRYSPEMICAPCKLIFGNYVEALEQGADHLIMLGGNDTCRLGYSVPLQVHLLRKLGYDFQPHVFDLRQAIRDVLRLTDELAHPPLSQKITLLRYLVALVTLVDDVERATLRLRPKELKPGTATRLRRVALTRICGLQTRHDLHRCRRAVLQPFADAPQDRTRRVLRIALIGDPYTISEPFFNLNLEEHLGRLGVEVHRWFWLSNSLRGTWPLRLMGLDLKARARRRAAAAYLSRYVGGFAQSSFTEAVRFAQDGIDGMIHVAPFNCTPEIVAASLMPRLAQDYDIPLLMLTFDEQTGEAGLVTRLEAFVDLLERRREREVA